MAAISNQPLFTTLYTSVDLFIPDKGSVYIHGVLGEERNAHSTEWEENSESVTFLRIFDQLPNQFSYSNNAETKEVPLRSAMQIDAFTRECSGAKIFLDITGLSHHVWAPILKAFIKSKMDVKVVYVEPSGYRFSVRPTEGDIFDLSERINGISPLPGFTVLDDTEGNDVCFIPLLGFEGPRFSYMLEQVQPPGEKIFPIIGVPGFRVQYPFYTYQGNQPALKETQSWKEVRFAAANCPFSLFYLLREISTDNPLDRMKIAPIGTKPHALGAILFSIQRSNKVEILYDHPVRKEARTEGMARLLVYDVAAFFAALY